MSCLQAIEVEDTKNPLICYIMNLLWLLRHTCSCLLDPKPFWHWGKWKSRPVCKGVSWSWHWPTGKRPLCRFKATNQLLYPAADWDQVGRVCTWQRSLSLDANTRSIKEISVPNQSGGDCYHRASNRSYQGHMSHVLSQGPRTTCYHCRQTLTIGHMLLECAAL